LKRFFLPCNFLFLISILLVTGAYAMFRSNLNPQNPCVAKWSGEREPVLIAANSSPQTDIYAQTEALFKEKRYDDVIRLLSGPAYAEPSNFRLNILLAEAQLEKCAILKAKGDMSYRLIINQAYRTGRLLNKVDKTRPEPYYIVAKSLLINDRVYRALRAIKKALYYSPHNADYLIVLGDGCFILAEHEEASGQAIRLLSIAKDAYERAIKIRKEDEEFKKNVEKKIRELSVRLKSRKERHIEEW